MKKIRFNVLEKEKMLSSNEMKSLRGGTGYNCYCLSDRLALTSTFFVAGCPCTDAWYEASLRCSPFPSGCDC